MWIVRKFSNDALWLTASHSQPAGVPSGPTQAEVTRGSPPSMHMPTHCNHIVKRQNKGVHLTPPFVVHNIPFPPLPLHHPPQLEEFQVSHFLYIFVEGDSASLLSVDGRRQYSRQTRPLVNFPSTITITIITITIITITTITTITFITPTTTAAAWSSHQRYINSKPFT